MLASEEFADSAQLSRFLRFAVECRLTGQTDRLKESVIGATVFRRGPDYDPKLDPIVRVEARRLRARLESYYARMDGCDSKADGADGAVKIVLPKGGYAPVFEPWFPSGAAPTAAAPVIEREPAAVQTAPDPVGQMPDAVRAKPAENPGAWRRWRWIAAVLGLMLIAIMSLRLTRPAPLPNRFWSAILAGDRPPLLIPADTGLVMFQDLVHKTVPLRDYITGEFRTPYAGDKALTAGIGWSFAGRRYTPAADLEFAVTLARRPEASRRGFETRFAREVRMEDLQGNNLILLGPRHMNPWMELFERNATFRLDHDEATSEYNLVNTSPAAGEIRGAIVSSTDVLKEIYGVINYHREGAHDVLMLSGTAVAGTEAAVRFVTDDGMLLPILKKAENKGRIRGFDVLLHGRNLAGSSFHADVVGFHVDK